MKIVTVRHKVKNFNDWKKVFDDHKPARDKAGLKLVNLQRSVDAENELLITMESSDLDKAREFAGSPDLKAAMERGGVTGPPEIFIGETV